VPFAVVRFNPDVKAAFLNTPRAIA
jgi:hypothetical protein